MDIEFFKWSYTKYANRVNYFGWNGYWPRAAKNPKRTRKLFEILDKGNPTSFEFVELGISIPAGRTGFEAGGARYRFVAENKGKKENFTLRIFIERDLCRDKSALWEFYGFVWGKEREKKEKSWSK